MDEEKIRVILRILNETKPDLRDDQHYVVPVNLRDIAITILNSLNALNN